MNVLQICHKPPYPPIDGGSIASYNLYRGLKFRDHKVHILAMNTYKQYCDINKVPEDLINASNYTLVDVDTRIRILPAFLNLFTRKSYNISRFFSLNFKETLSDLLLKNNYELIILESLFATPYIDTIRNITKAPIVLRSHNVEYKIWENLFRNEENRLKKRYLNLLYTRLRKYEFGTLKKPDLIASISKVDIEVFKLLGCNTPMTYIPFGINFEDDEFKKYFPPEKDELVLFHIGSMDWLPHQEAIKWFLENVWKEIIKVKPSIKLYLAGSKMPAWISNGNYPNVIVSDKYIEGKIFMQKKTIMVVPSFSGSGIRIKIAEGMAKGKVIITTANGAMGIPCTHGENIFISESKDEWVSMIIRCIDDLELTRGISASARRFAKQEFDYKSAADKLTDAVSKLDMSKSQGVSQN